MEIFTFTSNCYHFFSIILQIPYDKYYISTIYIKVSKVGYVQTGNKLLSFVERERVKVWTWNRTRKSNKLQERIKFNFQAILHNQGEIFLQSETFMQITYSIWILSRPIEILFQLFYILLGGNLNFKSSYLYTTAA